MKKLLLCIAGALALSCTNNESDHEASNLVSITTNYYKENFLSSSRKMIFHDGKPVSFHYSDGSYANYLYTNGLVSKIAEYAFNGDLRWLTQYTYDNNGRITGIERQYHEPDASVRTAKHTFVYNQDHILATTTYSPTDISVHQFSLNSDNKIISEKIISSNGVQLNSTRYNFTYTNGNLTSSTNNGSTSPISKTYSHTNRKNDFNYNKYVFGKQWKMNYSLELFSKGMTITGGLEITSENQLSDYIYNYTFHSVAFKDNGIYGYFYNDNNQMVKEVLSINSTYFGLSREESTYEYN